MITLLRTIIAAAAVAFVLSTSSGFAQAQPGAAALSVSMSACPPPDGITLASRTTLARFIQAGVIPTSTNAVLSETHRTWNRPEAAGLAKLYAIVAPNYAGVIESYQKAQEVARASK
jgi:hypothetical protein